MVDARKICFACMHELPSPNGVCPICGRDNSERRNGNGELPYALLAGKYIVGRALGRGGFGVTYVGQNVKLGKRVAIKEYFPADIAVRAPDRMTIQASSPENEAMFEEGKRKALDEARTIAMINSVPDVVRIYDCFSRNNTVYIIMEYIEGETLASRVARQGAMKWNEAWADMLPIAEALGKLHRQNLVHRDISPDNIMIHRGNGRPVLLDFGAASAKQYDGQKHGKLLKEGYAAMEQYQETSAIDGRTDEYSWSATLYYLVTGVRPANPMQRRFNEGCVRTPRKMRVRMPARAEAVLMKGMEVAPEDRYDTMEDLVEAMRAADAGGGTPRTKPAFSPWRAAGAACASLLAAVTLGSTYIGLRESGRMVCAPSGTQAYSEPSGTGQMTFDRDTYLRVLGTQRSGDLNWYKVCVPVDRELMVYYLSERDAEPVERARWNEEIRGAGS